MFRTIPTLILMAVILTASSCSHDGRKDKGEDREPEAEAEFARGADISWLSEMEYDMKAGGRLEGYSFMDSDGDTDALAILKNIGMNAVRLRVWVDPLDANGWSGKEDVITQAKRAATAGLSVMIDFHYCDFFADPGWQEIPAAWKDHSVAAVSEKVSTHTIDVMNALKVAGVTPQWVQIGNETTGGMLWPAGQLWTDDGDLPNGWSNYAALSNSGYEAVKSVFPDAVVITHIDNAWSDNEWWFTRFREAGGKFDMIGLSHYPMGVSGKSWSVANDLAITRIQILSKKFACRVMVCETGVDPSSPDASECLSGFMSAAKKLGTEICSGVFYWEPEGDRLWTPAVYDDESVLKHGRAEVWGAYGLGVFNRSGKTISPDMSILSAFNK